MAIIFFFMRHFSFVFMWQVLLAELPSSCYLSECRFFSTDKGQGVKFAR